VKHVTQVICKRLETGDKQIEAQNLYRRLGFQEAEPFYEIPEAFRGMVLFMTLPLA
jgi:ribosomal protein S18 acetylase RimI-like enzyme